jgi:hypothetical protein
MWNVDSWFVGVRDDDERAALSAAPNALLLNLSAEGVFGAVIARDDSQHDRINLSESGCCRNEALERHSEALHIGRCGGERDASNIRLVASAVNDDSNLGHRVFADSSGAQAGSTPAGRAERTVEAKRRALKPPSTA